MIGKKLCYLFNQSESLFPRCSFATHDPQFALSFACTLCAVNLGYTVCCTVFCTRFCYPQKTIFQSQGSGIWAQNSKAAPRLYPPSPPLRPNIDTCITNPTGASIYIRKDSLSPKVRWHKVSTGISCLWLWRSPSCRVTLSSFVSINKRLYL